MGFFIYSDILVILLFIDFMFSALAFAMIIVGIRNKTFDVHGLPVLEDNIISRAFKIIHGIHDYKFRYRNDSNIEFKDKYYASKPYIILGFLTGFIPFGFGIYALILMGNTLLLIWGIIVELFVLFPDILDNILPFNLKTLKGYTLLYIMPIISIIATFTF